MCSCENPTEAVETLPSIKTLYFPSKEQISRFTSDSTTTDLADFVTFSEYLEVAQDKACNWKSNLITFKDDDINYRVLSYTECPERRNFGCYFSTIFINIENDSILEYHEASQKLSRLKQHLLNLTNKEYNFKESNQLKNLVISITYSEDNPITNFKNTLIQITQTISKIEKSQKIHIPYYLYVGTNFMPPPPPPPFPKNE